MCPLSCLHPPFRKRKLPTAATATTEAEKNLSASGSSCPGGISCPSCRQAERKYGPPKKRKERKNTLDNCLSLCYHLFRTHGWIFLPPIAQNPTKFAAHGKQRTQWKHGLLCCQVSKSASTSLTLDKDNYGHAEWWDPQACGVLMSHRSWPCKQKTCKPGCKLRLLTYCCSCGIMLRRSVSIEDSKVFVASTSFKKGATNAAHGDVCSSKTTMFVPSPNVWESLQGSLQEPLRQFLQ